MITHESKFTFECDANHYGQGQEPLVIEAKTERTAIAKARAKGWDVLRVRAVGGVPAGKVARTIRLCYCPGCACSVGVTFR